MEGEMHKQNTDNPVAKIKIKQLPPQSQSLVWAPCLQQSRSCLGESKGWLQHRPSWMALFFGEKAGLHIAEKIILDIGQKCLFQDPND